MIKGVLMDYPKKFICKQCCKIVFNKHRSKSPKYCSRRCQADASIEKATIVRICGFCKEEFKAKRGQLSSKNKLKFCSTKCHGLWKRGANNPLYKTGESINGNGYVVLSMNGKRIKRSRYIMGEYLNRKLLRHEEVHHKNGDKADDSLDNLELWSTSHPSGQRVEDKINWAISFLKLYNYKVHDRDINAANVILKLGLGWSLDNDRIHAEQIRNVQPGNSILESLGGSQ